MPIILVKSGIEIQMYAKKNSNTKLFAKKNSKKTKKNSKIL